jgi:hypothetical protein
MDVKRRLSEGVASWILYEYHSFRANLIEEKYLITPINSILSGIYRSQVISEFTHPILEAHRMGVGRPPQIDFVIKNHQQKIEIAVESKWYGNSPVKVEDILWDLIRLELLSYEYETKCYFVIGGQKRRLRELFSSARFQEPKTKGSKRPILRLTKERKQSVRLDNPPPQRISLIKGKMQQYKDVLMPSSIITGYPSIYPDVCRNIDYQVYVWEISSYKNKPRFYPRENKNYL